MRQPGCSYSWRCVQRPVQHQHAPVPLDERLPSGDVGARLVRRVHPERRHVVHARVDAHGRCAAWHDPRGSQAGGRGGRRA
eukprot:1356207-Prymnesium_polylepis.1